MTDNPARAPRVLIIENDFLIGEMLHDMVAELGYSVTKVAHGLPSALNEISKENFDGALVNIGIDEQKHGSEIADILLAKNIPFGFVTGYGHALEQRHAGIPLLQKPFNSEQLRVLLEAIVGPGGSPNHTHLARSLISPNLGRIERSQFQAVCGSTMTSRFRPDEGSVRAFGEIFGEAWWIGSRSPFHARLTVCPA